MRKFLPLLLAFFVLPAQSLEARQQAQGLTMASVNEAEWQDPVKPSASLLVKLQILLDRAHASPGVIDGKHGENTRKAIVAFGEINGLESTEQADEHVWRMLTKSDSEAHSRSYAGKLIEPPARLIGAVPGQDPAFELQDLRLQHPQLRAKGDAGEVARFREMDFAP